MVKIFQRCCAIIVVVRSEDMDQIKVGKFIAQLRKEKGITQEELGRRIGVTNKTVSRWENGNYMPDIEMLQLLSEQFGVTIEELIAGERMDDSTLRARCNEIVVAAAKNEVFSIKEKTKFWKKKWLSEHKGIIIMLVIFAVVGYFAAFFLLDFLGESKSLAGMCWTLLCICTYGSIRNKMMIYVEGKIYGKCSKTE